MVCYAVQVSSIDSKIISGSTHAFISFHFFHDDFFNQSIFFENPIETLVVENPSDFLPTLEKLEKARADGKWSAGFISYEAGYLFEEKLRPLIEEGRKTPLMCFAIFDEPKFSLPDDLRRPASVGEKDEHFALSSNQQAQWDRETYECKFKILHDHLSKGDCYQANLTFPVHAKWEGDPLSAFWQMAKKQPAKYAAMVNLCEPCIVSRSPELFFKVDSDGWIETHPMKGTAPRGESVAEDLIEIKKLKESEKTQAENIMIVDLLRNDISRISQVSTLSVPKLFEVETYPTLHQMISRVRAKLKPEIGIKEIFEALFPCGSITGAPKLSAMQILKKLEQTPRDVYCGAIGYIGPGNQMRFNVAIRTLSLFENDDATFNVGGGIIWDSDADAEYDEALLKAKFTELD